MTYFIFELKVTPGSDEFWDDVLRDPEAPDIKAIKDELLDIFADRGYTEDDIEITLKRAFIEP